MIQSTNNLKLGTAINIDPVFHTSKISKHLNVPAETPFENHRYQTSHKKQTKACNCYKGKKKKINYNKRHSTYEHERWINKSYNLTEHMSRRQ